MSSKRQTQAPSPEGPPGPAAAWGSAHLQRVGHLQPSCYLPMWQGSFSVIKDAEYSSQLPLKSICHWPWRINCYRSCPLLETARKADKTYQTDIFRGKVGNSSVLISDWREVNEGALQSSACLQRLFPGHSPDGKNPRVSLRWEWQRSWRAKQLDFQTGGSWQRSNSSSLPRAPWSLWF
jgi:hypothetical protein